MNKPDACGSTAGDVQHTPGPWAQSIIDNGLNILESQRGTGANAASRQRKCVKCGGNDLFIRYKEEGAYEHDGDWRTFGKWMKKGTDHIWAHECLAIVCRCCGYRWIDITQESTCWPRDGGVLQATNVCRVHKRQYLGQCPECIVKGRQPVDNAAQPDEETLAEAGWQVPASLAEAVREVVAAGAAESQNAFVERALLRELAELRRERLFAAYAEAADDRVFTSDMNAVSRSFDSATPDGSVHEAYLTTCARLGWEVKPANHVPYAELSDDSKELDRASVRAVLARLAGGQQDELLGRTMREVERLREQERRRDEWLRKAKEDAGYPTNVSFDNVWADALAALKEKQATGDTKN